MFTVMLVELQREVGSSGASLAQALETELCHYSMLKLMLTLVLQTLSSLSRVGFKSLSV